MLGRHLSTAIGPSRTEKPRTSRPSPALKRPPPRPRSAGFLLLSRSHRPALIYGDMLWRISPKRSRRTPPAGFILPCQPLLVDKPPAGVGWLHEIKHDGYRIITRKEGSRVILWSRHGTNFTDKLPKVAEAVCSLAAESALIDGEAVTFRSDGHSRFCRLAHKGGLGTGVPCRIRSIEPQRRGPPSAPA